MTQATHTYDYRERLAYPGGLLGAMALLASTVLVLGYLGTREQIAQRLAEDMQASLEQVIPSELHDNDLLTDNVLIKSTPATNDSADVRVYRARKQGQVVAVAYEVGGQGYGGVIKLIMGVDREGEILGVRVVSHTETPGLGDKIESRKSDWILDFNGRSLSNPNPAGWNVKKDGGEFDQFSGATITPRAVVKTVRLGLKFFADHRQDLFMDHPDGQTGTDAGRTRPGARAITAPAAAPGSATDPSGSQPESTGKGAPHGR